MPSDAEVKRFCDTIANQLHNNPDTFVGVHCTHGLNRTGYFICRYMIDYMGFLGPMSVKLFEESRGHRFDRDNYRESLMRRNPNNECDTFQDRPRGDRFSESGTNNRHNQRDNHRESFTRRNANEYDCFQDWRRGDYPGSNNRDSRTGRVDNRSRSRDLTGPSGDDSFGDYRSYQLNKDRRDSDWRRVKDDRR